MEINKYMVRAKNYFDGKWHYGYIIPIKYQRETTFMRLSEAQGDIRVQANTICRPTMLLDKNGNMIWENDVVKCTDVIHEGKIQIKGKVGYIKDFGYAFGFVVDGEAKYLYKSIRLEVLGNKFDNPNLLQTEDDLKEIIEGE